MEKDSKVDEAQVKPHLKQEQTVSEQIVGLKKLEAVLKRMKEREIRMGRMPNENK